MQGFLGHVQGGDADFAVGQVFLAEKATIGGDVLVLLADGLAEAVHFDFDGFLGQGFGGDGFALPGVERMEQADQKRP